MVVDSEIGEFEVTGSQDAALDELRPQHSVAVLAWNIIRPIFRQV